MRWPGGELRRIRAALDPRVELPVGVTRAEVFSRAWPPWRPGMRYDGVDRADLVPILPAPLRAAASGRGALRPGPKAVYPLKAAMTRARSIAWLLHRSRDPQEEGLRLLFYHRIADDGDELAVKPRRFREQMQLLADLGYRAIDVVDAVALLDAGTLPPRTIGLSFDDGFRDVAERALPVLTEHGFRATVFVATGVVDGTAAFEWYEEQPPVLSWDEIVELDRARTLRFEAHSVTHPNLLALNDEQAQLEIEGSKRDLESRLGRPSVAFCYPAGLFGERERRLARRAGFRLGVSCEPGLNLRSQDRYMLRRLQIDARDRLLDFRAKLAGGHDAPPPARAAYRRLRYGATPALSSSRR
jgi:peptidoglycan/xylan/chitin deacetylase (PgdA/CDA1 family)